MMDTVREWWLPVLALLAGIVAMTAVWTAVSGLLDRPCGWMAPLLAADLALLAKLSGAPDRAARCVLAQLGTVAGMLLSGWLVAAGGLAGDLGEDVLRLALRLSPELAWQLLQPQLGYRDLAWIVAAPPLAAWLTWPSRWPEEQANAAAA
jgi:hypothetical protein